MKTLIIVRHGKSSWDHTDLQDHHRPLKQRGVNNAILVAEEFAKIDVMPDLILSSPAVRALDTAIIIATRLGYPLNDILTDHRIYEASIPDLISVLANVDDEHGTLMIFGHNPSFTALINRLQDESIFNLPTCGVFAIELPIESWADIKQTKGKKSFAFFPKELD